jgi:molecular chaperone GrpE
MKNQKPKHHENPFYPKVLNAIDLLKQSNVTIEDQIKQITATFQDQVAQIKTLFQEKISTDEMKNNQFEKLYEELEKYRNNFIFETTQKRIFLELIGVYDHIEELLKLANNDLSKEDIIQHIASLKKQILQVLINQGVDQITTKGEKFDPRLQEAVDVFQTEKAEENQIIHEVISNGFIYDNKRILKPQKVIVKKYTNQIKKEV